MEQLFHTYAPIIIVVIMFIFQYNMVVTPVQMVKAIVDSEEKLRLEFDKKYVSQDRYLASEKKIDEMYDKVNDIYDIFKERYVNET